MSTASRVQAPFTTRQVTSLNAYQTSGVMHPFTCANRGDGHHDWRTPDLGMLVATLSGWVCPDCNYRQDWAHDFMTDWGWRTGDPISQLDALFSTPRPEGDGW